LLIYLCSKYLIPHTTITPPQPQKSITLETSHAATPTPTPTHHASKSPSKSKESQENLNLHTSHTFSDNASQEAAPCPISFFLSYLAWLGFEEQD
jgi:hypothetical protein